MQSFILDRHTDPSNPTMKVTQDDKIPIYDSKADAEADLANIEEGGIVATKDTGASEKVVDVVQDGNMNPVTSNAVYDAINEKTGGRTFRNVVIPGNYYNIDSSSAWTVAKVNRMFTDLISAIGISASDETAYTGQVAVSNGNSYVGSFVLTRYGDGFMSVNLHSYDIGLNYRLIMASGNPRICRVDETQI